MFTELAFESGEEVVIAGGFVGVRVFLTDTTYKNCIKLQKWSDTGMQGILKLVRVKDVEGVPIINLRLYGTDESYEALTVILEYELPINFTFEAIRVGNFSALHIMKGQHLGFLFANKEDKIMWDRELEVLTFKLSLTKA